MREPAVGGRRQGVLHDADQGAVEPEVPRAAGRLRRRPGRPAHRRHQHQRQRPHRGHDHRGAPQHALRRFVRAAGAALRRHGRGALPRRPLPRCGVGGDHHPPAAGRATGLAERDGLQRRGVRRLARHGARRHRGDRLGDPPRAARAARPGARRSAAAVRRPCRHRDRAGQPGAHAHPVVQGLELREQPPRAVDAQRRESGRGLRGGSAPSEQGRQPSGALGERAAHRAARPARGRRAAAAIEPAAGDLLHLQPRRVRRSGSAGASFRGEADHAGGARRDPRDRRRAHPHPARRGPRRARLLRMARQPRARCRLAPRRAAAGLQGGRRGALPAQAGEGRVRDRDARARHQHARAHRGAREAREVQRRSPRGDHLGGVHPAHRPRRTPRHRRRGSRGHPVDRGPRPAAGRRARIPAHLSAQLQLPPDLQHGRQPDRPVRPGAARARSSSRRSRSSRPTAPSSGSPARCASRRSRSPATRRR